MHTLKMSCFAVCTLTLSVSKKLRSRAFCWCIVCFCTSNGSIRILKKARGNIFLKWYYLEEIVKIVSFWKKFSSLFQYSDRTVASTETNNTSAESLGSQLFGTRKIWAWHGQEGATLTCRKRHWKKKVNLTELSQDAKNFFFRFQFNILMLWAKCMPIDFEFDKVYFASSLIARPTP